MKIQLVVLTLVLLIRLHEAFKGRYRTARYRVRAIFGSLTKPLADGTCPKEDIVRITSDQDLVDFIITAKKAYSPVWLQMQVHKKNTHNNTPPPDECPYFELEDFKPLDPMADYYNAPENDSDAAAYFLTTGKRKNLAWPRTDGGFEMGKYDARHRIKRLEKHLERLKTKQRANIHPNTIVYDSNSDEYGWMLWLNPKTPDEWVRSRRAARLGLVEKNAKMAAGIDEDEAEEAGEDKALEVWGKDRNPRNGKDEEFGAA